ncbi:ABC transporter ATP-binding protein [Bradyrhizobium cenepequi]
MNRTEIAIRARGLRKAYRVYAHAIDPLLEAIRRVPRHTERVALQSVDLELRRGEIVGILGRNGAGKSTLLKIIAGTLERSSGELEVNGRITAILELGTGFHPDYTGRENILMGGLCLGMTKAEIEGKVDSIIEFSELRDVIDQPFKTYSTGMQARLTFATAISVEPDILIVDEALSVGDARFQMKCFGWIQRLKQKNATILLVSHDTNTITTFCDRALILEDGRVFAEGETKAVVSSFLRVLFGDNNVAPATPNHLSPDIKTDDGDLSPGDSIGASGNSSVEREGEAPEMTSSAADQDSATRIESANSQHDLVRFGSGEMELMNWSLRDQSGQVSRAIESGANFTLSMEFIVKSDVAEVSCGFAIKDVKGTVVWGTTNISALKKAQSVRAGQRLLVTVPCTMWLSHGDYFINLGAGHLSDGQMIDFIEDAIAFSVYGPGVNFTTSVVNLDSTFMINVLDHAKSVNDNVGGSSSEVDDETCAATETKIKDSCQ